MGDLLNLIRRQAVDVAQAMALEKRIGGTSSPCRTSGPNTDLAENGTALGVLGMLPGMGALKGQPRDGAFKGSWL
jgi:hypothetical protein